MGDMSGKGCRNFEESQVRSRDRILLVHKWIQRERV
jgi:hypothetical protein